MSGEINKRLEELQRLISGEKLAEVAFPVFRKTTPIRSGFARSRTVQYKDQIIANYPYATRLDQGYSKQAPDGMTQPTIKFVENYIRKVKK